MAESRSNSHGTAVHRRLRPLRPAGAGRLRQPWLARGKAAYLSPQATRVQGRRPSSFALRLPEGSGGGYVKNLDATKTSLIIGASIRVVPYENTYTEPLLLGVRDANAQIAHLVKIGEDGGSSSTAGSTATSS
jgi:hypothetical protein